MIPDTCSRDPVAGETRGQGGARASASQQTTDSRRLQSSKLGWKKLQGRFWAIASSSAPVPGGRRESECF